MALFPLHKLSCQVMMFVVYLKANEKDIIEVGRKMDEAIKRRIVHKKTQDGNKKRSNPIASTGHGTHTHTFSTAAKNP